MSDNHWLGESYEGSIGNHGPQIEDHEFNVIFSETYIWAKLRCEGMYVEEIKALICTGNQEYPEANRKLLDYLGEFLPKTKLRLFYLEDEPERGYIVGWGRMSDQLIDPKTWTTESGVTLPLDFETGQD